MPATPQDVIDAKGPSNSVFAVTTDGTDRVEFNLEHQTDWADIARNNIGEDCGEDIPGWSSAISGYDESTERAYILGEPEELALNGYVYDLHELVGQSSSLGFSFPQIPYDYSNATKDMNGRTRFPKFSIGAIESVRIR